MIKQPANLRDNLGRRLARCAYRHPLGLFSHSCI